MAAQAPAKIDRQTTTPFLLRLFYRNGAFHRLDEFASARLPPHLQIYTWQTCTLKELTHLLLTALPTLLPASYAGTRIAFRLAYADLQGPSRPGSSPRYITRELGSVIVGAAGIDSEDKDNDTEMQDAGGEGSESNVKDALKQLEGELNKTLADARFVIGDYVCAAVFPPLADGSVAAAPPPPSGPSARGPPPRDGYGSRGGRENGFGGRGDFGYGSRGRGGRFEDRRGGGFPAGEWRRGEAPPERERERERERDGRDSRDGRDGRDGYWRGGGGGGGGGGSRGRGRGRW